MILDLIKTNQQNLRRQTPRFNQLSLNQRIAEYTCNYFDIYIYIYIYIQNIQISGGNMLEFFKHESWQYPSVMAKVEEMRSGTKADLVKCILSDSTTSTTDAQPKATGAVLEGSPLVN